jgi:HK97 family phage major capsid protein
MKSNKTAFLEQAATLLSAKEFSRESASRCSMLLALAEKIGDAEIQPEAERRFSKALRGDRGGFPENRDLDSDPGMTEAGGSPAGSLGGYTVPESFATELFSALKNTDPIFDSGAFNFPIETASGAAMKLPILIDVTEAATKMDEGAQQTAQQNIASVGRISFPETPTYRSGFVVASLELVQDSRWPMESILANAFALRFARGIGPDLVSALIDDATLGTTALGDLNKPSPDPQAEIGYQDLVNLKLSLDSAFRAAGPAVWIMTDDTLTALDNLISTTGQPIITPQYDPQGNRLLLGYRVGISPSMDEIEAGSKPICFYCPKFFVVRKVAGVKVQIFTEKFALRGQVGYQSILRCSGALQVTGDSAPSPAVYLQMGGNGD